MLAGSGAVLTRARRSVDNRLSPSKGLATAMSAPAANIVRRSRPGPRRMLATVMCAAAALIGLVARERYRQRREFELAEAIGAAGGRVELRPSLEDRFRAFLDGRRLAGTNVLLPLPEIDDDWLRNHGYLSDLGIDSLTIGNARISATSLARVLADHPVERLFAAGEELNAEAIDALADNGRLKELHLGGTPLSDADFTRLPLEQLERLDISETGISPQALQQLRRCRKLWDLDIDGTQFNDETARVLQSIPTLTHLTLTGPEVGNNHLLLLYGLRDILHVRLWSTNVSAERLVECRQLLRGRDVVW
jgi:hypothetical protein